MKYRLVAFVLLLLVLSIRSIHAQLTTGTISGVVTDPSGAIVPGATVTAKNLGTGFSRSTISGATGRYDLPNLPVGSYEVSSELAGFQRIIRTGIELTVGRTVVVDLTMQVGEVTQAVTVTGEVPLVETATATVASLVDERKVADLPLNNRDLTQLVFLQPGVLQVPRELDNIGYRSGMGQTFSVGGARGNQNTYLLDGMSNSDPSGNAAGAAQSYIGAETVKEFQIILNNYSAEYQSLPGAIVSAVTKSGSNTFHWSAFEFIRNDNLDAAKWDNKIVPQPAGRKAPKNEFKRNQFGGSAGGPIVRDRTFFFGSYEGLRERQSESDRAIVPTMAARSGNLGSVGNFTVAESVKPYLALYPVPGEGNTVGTDFGDGRVEIFGTQRVPVNDDYVAAKIDHQFAGTKAGFLSGTFNFDDANRDGIDMLGDLTSRGTLSRKYILSVKHTSILTNTLVNEFSFGYNKTKIVGEIPLNNDRDFSSIAFRPGVKLLGQLSVGDITGLGFSNSAAETRQRTLAFKDALSLSRGNHSWKMGAELSFIRDEDMSCPPGCHGNYEFRDLRRFVTATVRRFDGLLPAGTDFPGYRMNQLSFGAYLQDDYRMTGALTLNLGIRYEFVTIPKEENDSLVVMKSFYDTKQVPGPFFKSNPTLKSFSPRIGIAFAPGARKTSVRLGAGIFYDHPMLYETRTNLGEMPPFRTVGRLDADVAGTPPILFPNAYSQIALARVTPNLRAAQWDIDTTYIYRWSLNLQQELMSNWLLTAGYTGSRAVHLWNQYQPNLNRWEGFPNQPTGAKFFPAVSQGRINPAFGQIRWQASNGNSYHHGLALSAQQRLTNGLQFQVSYNFAKTIDQGADVTGGELATPQRTIYFFDTHLLKAPSSQDIKHSFVTNFSYEIPFGRNLTGMGGVLAKGWQMNGIVTLTTGYPLTITDSSSVQQTRLGETALLTANLIPGGDQNPTTGTTAGCTGVAAGQKLGGPHSSIGVLYYDPCQFEPSTPGYFGNLGRSTLISPGLVMADLSLFKNFELSEESRIQFRAEMFNLINRVNLAAPDTSPFTSASARDPNAGQIINTRTSPRQIQFGLKFIF
ncbi:MAG TPA: TonB-dependent receptor [Terriglobia bacterium]|nr:TonB-dependent receptor [Terriglobia bacterium]